MGILLQDFETFDLWEEELDDVENFTKFVFGVYYEHHWQSFPPIEEVEACVKEDLARYPHTHFYTLKTKQGRIFGTINASVWLGTYELAFEQEYNLSIRGLIETRDLAPPQVWHIGRFAIDRKFINENETLSAKQMFFFKLLMVCAFVHVCKDPNNLMIVESEVKLWRIGKLLGISTEALGEARMVLGSESFPAIDTGAGLKSFVDKHKHLLCYDIQSK
jgi:hypothetical protein